MSLYILLVYMVVNCITDILYLKTKNLWHGFFIVLLIILALWLGLPLINLALTLFLTLVLGLLLSRIQSIGAGDIKMLVISSIIIFIDYPMVSSYWAAFLEIAFYMVFSVVVIAVLVSFSLILRFFISGTFFGYNKLVFMKYELSTTLKFPFKLRLKWCIPGAPNILLANILLLVFYKSII